MSVQLIVYPQWYNGVLNPISGPSWNQMIAYPSDFTMTSTSHVVTNPSALSLIVIASLFPTMIPNKWYGYYRAGFGGVTGGLNSLKLHTTSSGTFQRLSGMTAGGLYDVKITWDSSHARQVMLKIYNGTTIVSTQYPTPTAPTYEVTLQFTAPSADDTVINIDYNDGVAFTIITEVSCKLAGQAPPTPIQNLSNGAVSCDLYEDEDIPLTLSVDNFKNAAEQVHSYSKAFNLPGTKRNNQIFDNLFEVTRYVDGNSILFNPLIRTKAVLKQDGVLLFEGFLRMLDISEKEGELSYNVNLYSEVIALADTLEDRKFSDLGFQELEHDYTYSNIRNSWVGGLVLLNPLPAGTFAGTAGATTTGVLRYPFVDWNHQFNVSLTSGNPELPNLESAFRPWIRLKYIIDMIFNATEFTYSSNFFNTSDFEKLFMDFNWGEGNAPVTINSSGGVTIDTLQGLTTSFSNILFQAIPGSPLSSSFGFDFSTGVFTALQDGQTYDCVISVPFQAQTITGATVIAELVVNGVVTANFTHTFATWFNPTTWLLSVSITLNAGETWYLQAKETAAGNAAVRDISPTPALTLITNSTQTTNATLLETLRGDLGQWEFLKGIMTMFNLITMPNPDNPNELIIEPYSEVFATPTSTGTNLASRGIQHNWTDKIDITQMKLEPLADLKSRVIFQYAEDDEDFCFNEYKRQVQPIGLSGDSGHLYGSKLWDARNLNLLEGTETISAEPFAATIPAALMPQYTDFIIPKIYASEDGAETEGFNNAPRIMYQNGVHNLTSCTYQVPAQNGGGAVSFEDEYLRFSHLTDVPTVLGDTFDYNFGECQLLPGVGMPVTSNLFNIHWLPYYAELYNPNTRTMNIKVNLDAGDISRFEFNDRVMIKNRVYRVNEINYKPNDLSTVEFILIG
jgi:hypothetical protein